MDVLLRPKMWEITFLGSLFGPVWQGVYSHSMGGDEDEEAGVEMGEDVVGLVVLVGDMLEVDGIDEMVLVDEKNGGR